MARNERAERALYYSIWALLLIGIAIWKFRPGPELPPKEIPIRLTAEVRPWFSEAVVQRSRGNSYTVGLRVTPEYKRSLRTGAASVDVGYRIFHAAGTSSEGGTTVHISQEGALGTALVTDSDKDEPTGIEFFLRH